MNEMEVIGKQKNEEIVEIFLCDCKLLYALFILNK